VVVSNQKECELAQSSIDSLSATKPIKYAGTIATFAVNKRPPGCFVNTVIQTQQCVNHVCIQFNGKADFSKHDQFPETARFRSICVPATKISGDDTRPSTKRASIVWAPHLRTAKKTTITSSTTADLVPTTSAARWGDSANRAISRKVSRGPTSRGTVSVNPSVVAAVKTSVGAEAVFASAIVVAGVVVVLVLVGAGVGMYWCHKKKRKAESEKQVAEQDNAIATLRSAVAAPMMDPNLSANEAMKIWHANGLMLNAENITLGPKIGYGGAGQVYRGTWGTVEVALKESYSLSISGKAKEIINEVSTLTKLMHPKIVRLFGMWYDNSYSRNPKLYMVMEYCALGSVADHIGKDYNQVSKEQRQAWCIQISEAMAFLHTRDPCIVHRDLKPANVLLDQNKDCKVADFGLSRDVTESNRDFTQNIGTVAYMPPEALETSQSCGDEPKHCSEASELLGTKWDVYSYAIMYLYILTGQRPYRGLDNRQIMLFVFMKNELERPRPGCRSSTVPK